jgi:hypothetical protein
MKSGLIIATVLIGCVYSAMADWVDPTNGWEAQYNASAGYLPDSTSTVPTWSVYQYTSTTAQMVDNAELGHTVLALDNTSTVDKWAHYRVSSGYGSGSSTDKITLDMKVQLVEDIADGQFQLIFVRYLNETEVQSWFFNLSTTGITTSIGKASADIGLGWNTYRILVDVENGTASLYLNESSTPLAENISRSVSTATGNVPRIQFGDGSSGIIGEANVDYIKWTNSEFAPVPEPFTLAILSAGGILVTAVRRKM